MRETVSESPGSGYGVGENAVGEDLRTRKRTFVCSWSECQRVFGKLEHLQRHERSRKLCVVRFIVICITGGAK